MLENSYLSTIKKLFDSCPICVIILDRYSRVIYLNPEYQKFLHVQDKDAVGYHVTKIIKNSRLPHIIQTGKPMLGVWYTFENGQKALCHLVPIFQNNQIDGAYGIVLFNEDKSLEVLSNQIKHLEESLEYYKSKDEKKKITKYTVDDIIGQSPIVAQLRKQIAAVAKNKSAVFITGESGSGKELVAQSIHALSPRRQKPFVRVNCSAIPENLFESELFGYEPGSFTGAKKNGYAGKFEQANGGTIFLDEIGEMPMSMQPKLLRVLQEKELTRIGATSPVKLDVKLISATNRNLENMISQGKFREDLYYRLDVLEIYVPTLKERGHGDIKILANHFLDEISGEYGDLRYFNEDVIELLAQYTWPGNIRELNNIIEKIYASSTKEEISIDDIPLPLIMKLEKKEHKDQKNDYRLSLDECLNETEKKLVEKVLTYTHNNISQTASILKISRNRLYRIMEKMNQN